MGAQVRVCLVDGNAMQTDQRHLFAEGDFDTGIDALLADPKARTIEHIDERATRHYPERGYSVFHGPVEPVAPQRLRDLYSEALEALRYHYDLIIIDTPVFEPGHGLFEASRIANAGFLAASDAVIGVVNNDLPTITNTQIFLRNELESKMGNGGRTFDSSNVFYIINRWSEDDRRDLSISTANIKDALGAWKLLGLIPEAVNLQKARNSRSGAIDALIGDGSSREHDREITLALLSVIKELAAELGANHFALEQLEAFAEQWHAYIVKVHERRTEAANSSGKGPGGALRSLTRRLKGS